MEIKFLYLYLYLYLYVSLHVALTWTLIEQSPCLPTSTCFQETLGSQLEQSPCLPISTCFQETGSQLQQPPCLPISTCFQETGSQLEQSPCFPISIYCTRNRITTGTIAMLAYIYMFPRNRITIATPRNRITTGTIRDWLFSAEVTTSKCDSVLQEIHTAFQS